MRDRRLVIAVVAVLISAQAATAQKWRRNEGIPLRWLPTTELGDLDPIELTGITAVPIAVAPFEDERSGDPGAIGVNEEDARRKHVTTPDDVPEHVRRHVARLLGELGFTVVESQDRAALTLGGSLRRFFVVERNIYEGEAVFLAQLRDAAEEVVFEALVTGSSTRFGRSYKDENYYETLSDALVEAVHGLASMSGFREALRAAAAD